MKNINTIGGESAYNAADKNALNALRISLAAAAASKVAEELKNMLSGFKF